MSPGPRDTRRDVSPGIKLACMDETPEPAERGRYAIFEEPDGGLAIPRSAPLCERCATCGCGEQQEPLRIPAMIVRLWQARQNGDGAGMAAQIKAARGLLKL